MKLVILGDQGVLSMIRTDGIRKAAHWQLSAGAAEAVARLNHAGFRTVMTADPLQPEGPYRSLAVMQQAHAHMHTELSAVGALVDAVFFAPDETPRPRDAALHGLLVEISDRYQVPLQGLLAVYGNHRDAGIAARAGCTTCLLGAAAGGAAATASHPLAVYRDLPACADQLAASATHAG